MKEKYKLKWKMRNDINELITHVILVRWVTEGSTDGLTRVAVCERA